MILFEPQSNPVKWVNIILIFYRYEILKYSSFNFSDHTYLVRGGSKVCSQGVSFHSPCTNHYAV